MRRLGWEGTLVAMGLALAAAAVPANAAYVMNMTGPANANPGAIVAVNVVLTGAGPHDSMLFDVALTRSAGAPRSDRSR